MDRVQRVHNAIGELRVAMADLVGSLDLADGTHDEAAEIIVAAEAVAGLAAEARVETHRRVLNWFLENRWGHRDVVIGDERYYGHREKREKVRDLPAAMSALATLVIGEEVGTATWGDEENAAVVFRAIGNLAASVVSSNGLKVGACRSILGEAAERGGGSEDEIRDRAKAMFLQHWSVEYPDSLRGQPEARKLGVANLRFLTRNVKDERTKKDLVEIMARAEEARQRALDLEAFSTEGDEGEGDSSAPGSWSRAVRDLPDEG